MQVPSQPTEAALAFSLVAMAMAITIKLAMPMVMVVVMLVMKIMMTPNLESRHFLPVQSIWTIHHLIAANSMHGLLTDLTSPMPTLSMLDVKLIHPSML